MKIPEINPIVTYLSLHTKVSEEEKEALDKITLYKSFNKNEIIHREGDILKNVALLVEGAVRFYYIDEEGQEQTVEFAFENSPIGDFNSFINPSPSKASGRALENTLLAGVSYDSFNQFFNQHPRYYVILSTVLSTALTDLEKRDKLLRIASSRERYEQLCEMRPEIIQRVPLTYIASYLRMALGTLSRVRAGKL